MARKRMIDPDFWTDEALGLLPVPCRLLFMGLISNADDEGRLRGHPGLIRATIFPYDELSNAEIDNRLSFVAAAGLIRRYEVDGQMFIDLPNFLKHQTINKPTPSKLPSYDDRTCNDGDSPTAPLPEDYGSPTAPLPPKLKEEKLREGKSARAREEEPPAITEESTELTTAEQYIAACVREIRGMANVPAVDVVMYVRECIDNRGSPLAEFTLRSEFQKFRDYWQERRSNQPANKKWTGWKRAMTNWMSEIPDEPEQSMSMLDALYPVWTGDGE